jgi:preprotein translocase subunit SecE
MLSIIQKPANFLRQVRQELSKVSWSSRSELLGSTVVVIVITGILAVFIGVIDLALSKLLTIVFK